MVPITDTIAIPDDELEWSFARSGGPGGQNVNKVSSKVDVRVDIAQIAGLTEAARARLLAAARSRIDADGMLRVISQRTRDQARNIEDALEKIRALIAAALVEPVPRRRTRPSRGAVEARLSEKRRTSDRKRTRRAAPGDGDPS